MDGKFTIKISYHTKVEIFGSRDQLLLTFDDAKVISFLLRFIIDMLTNKYINSVKN